MDNKKTYFGNSIIILFIILVLIIGVFFVFPFLFLDDKDKMIFIMNLLSNISGVAISVFLTLYFLDKYYRYEKEKSWDETVFFLSKKIKDFFGTYCTNISNVFDIDFIDDIEFSSLSVSASHYLQCIEMHMTLIDQFESRYDCLKDVLTKTDKDLLKDFQLDDVSLDEVARIKHKLKYFDFENLLYICGNIAKHLLSLPEGTKVKELIVYFEEIEKNLFILKQMVLNNGNEFIILKNFRALSISLINLCRKLMEEYKDSDSIQI